MVTAPRRAESDGGLVQRGGGCEQACPQDMLPRKALLIRLTSAGPAPGVVGTWFCAREEQDPREAARRPRATLVLGSPLPPPSALSLSGLPVAGASPSQCCSRAGSQGWLSRVNRNRAASKTGHRSASRSQTSSAGGQTPGLCEDPERSHRAPGLF